MSINFKFDYKIDGRKVSEQEFMQGIASEAIDEIAEDRKRAVSRLRCPEHHESPKVVKIDRTGGLLQFQISACCETLLQQAQKVAAGNA